MNHGMIDPAITRSEVGIMIPFSVLEVMTASHH